MIHGADKRSNTVPLINILCELRDALSFLCVDTLLHLHSVSTLHHGVMNVRGWCNPITRWYKTYFEKIKQNKNAAPTQIYWIDSTVQTQFVHWRLQVSTSISRWLNIELGLASHLSVMSQITLRDSLKSDFLMSSQTTYASTNEGENSVRRKYVFLELSI